MSNGLTRQRIQMETASGRVVLTPGRNHVNGWSLSVNGTCQSYVDLDVPEYMHWNCLKIPALLAEAVLKDVHRPSLIHIGGSAAAIPRRLGVTLHEPLQLVIEADGDLVDIVERYLPIDPAANVVMVSGFGEQVIPTLEHDSADLVVLDAYHGNSMPEALRTPDFIADVDAVMKGDGVLVVNILDLQGMIRSREYGKTLKHAFNHIALVGTPGMFKGTSTHSNSFVLASASPIHVDSVNEYLAGKTTYRCRLVN